MIDNNRQRQDSTCDNACQQHSWEISALQNAITTRHSEPARTLARESVLYSRETDCRSLIGASFRARGSRRVPAWG